MTCGRYMELVSGIIDQRSHHWGGTTLWDHDDRPYDMAIVLSMDAFGHGTCYGENPWKTVRKRGPQNAVAIFKQTYTVHCAGLARKLDCIPIGWDGCQSNIYIYTYIQIIIYIYILVTRIYIAIMCGFPLDG